MIMSEKSPVALTYSTRVGDNRYVSDRTRLGRIRKKSSRDQLSKRVDPQTWETTTFETPEIFSGIVESFRLSSYDISRLIFIKYITDGVFEWSAYVNERICSS